MASEKRKYVVITRAEEQAQHLHDLLFSEDIFSLICPLLFLKYNDIKYPDSCDIQAVILTSSRAIEAMIHADVLDRYLDLRCFCVGGDTAQLARDNGFKKVHIGMGGAKGLSVLLGSTLKTDQGALFYPCGADVAYPLKADLEQNGYKVIERAVYQMQLSDGFSRLVLEALRDNEIGSVTFYSARTAEHFAQLVERHKIAGSLGQIKALCISQSVLEYVQHINWVSTHVADRPDGQGMVDLIKLHS